jgi:hypothetical protein
LLYLKLAAGPYGLYETPLAAGEGLPGGPRYGGGVVKPASELGMGGDQLELERTKSRAAATMPAAKRLRDLGRSSHSLAP